MMGPREALVSSHHAWTKHHLLAFSADVSTVQLVPTLPLIHSDGWPGYFNFLVFVSHLETKPITKAREWLSKEFH